MRCWAAPASPLANAEIAANPATKLDSGSLAGAIQLEVVPQHVGHAEHEDISAILKPKPTIEAEGVTFPRLLLEASLTNDDLLLIVPERPDAEWRPKAAPNTNSTDAPGAHPLGPPLPPSPTLGELMLTDLSSGAHRNLRRIIVISPIPPKKYNLLAQR
jgi:hypothetical protein